MKMYLSRDPESGKTTLAALFVALILGAASSSLLTEVSSTNRQHSATRHRLLSLNLAEAGLSRAMVDLRNGGEGTLGTENNPVTLGSGDFWTITAPNEDQTEFRVTAFGRCQGETKVLQAVVQRTGGLFDNAVFAGNDDDDPNYVMGFSGWGNQADQVVGDVFSGGDLSIGGDVDIDGELRASGDIIGDTGEEGKHQPVPDISAMNYEVNHDVNVADEFDAYASYQSDSAGGTAWQVPSSYLSHIFRKNPTDRSSENASTTKDDYYLEDPYETVRSDSSSDGSNAYEVSMGSDAADKVYFIDGNLWVHNYSTYSMMLTGGDSNGLKATFVIKGNLYISDNIFYEDIDNDGVVFIAMEDENVEDSGNIYFGDPEFGTLEAMQSYMYAENNFHDNNLNSSGSAVVDLFGIMSAGNQVSINRDWGDEHSRLSVTLDRRVKDGEIDLPGLPEAQAEPQYTMVAWREVSRWGDYTTDAWTNDFPDGGTVGDGGTSDDTSGDSGQTDDGNDQGSNGDDSTDDTTDDTSGGDDTAGNDHGHDDGGNWWDDWGDWWGGGWGWW